MIYLVRVTLGWVIDQHFTPIAQLVTHSQLRLLAGPMRTRCSPDDELDSVHELKRVHDYEVVQAFLIEVDHFRCVVQPVQLRTKTINNTGQVTTYMPYIIYSRCYLVHLTVMRCLSKRKSTPRPMCRSATFKLPTKTQTTNRSPSTAAHLQPRSSSSAAHENTTQSCTDHHELLHTVQLV